MPTETVIGPVIAPTGTTARIKVSVQAVGAAANTPLANITALEPWDAPNPVPLIETDEPIWPLGGVRLVITGPAGCLAKAAFIISVLWLIVAAAVAICC